MKISPVIAAAIAVTILTAGVGFSISSRDGETHRTWLAQSPDGKFDVIKVVEAGGGISPYCSVTLLVAPAATATNEERYEVFSSECGDFSDHSQSPKATWISSTELKITFSINGTAALPAKVRLKKVDDSGRVQLRFEAVE